MNRHPILEIILRMELELWENILERMDSGVRQMLN